MKKKLIYLAISVGVVIGYFLLGLLVNFVTEFFQKIFGYSDLAVLFVWSIVLIGLIYSILIEADKKRKEGEK